MSLDTKTVKVLGPAGVLARSWERFEPREGQLEAARAAAWALENRHKAVLEAGTGTGKTLAYLVPLILSGLRATVSTATKNLQEQIVFKDLPFLREHLAARPKVCLVKGRTNYLCRRRLTQSLTRGRIDPWLGQRLTAWADSSRTGDRAEVDFLPEDDPTWARLTASSEQCLGQRCDLFGSCFITALRRRAQGADLVVANHHLFMADLALRQGGHGQVLPDSEAVVFDEAHELEEAATSHFTVAVSDRRIMELAKDLTEAAGGGAGDIYGELNLAVSALIRTLNIPGERAELSDRVLTPEVMEAGQGLIESLARAKLTAIREVPDEGEAQGLAARAESMSDALAMILERMEPEYVYYAERMRLATSLRAAPVEVAKVLEKALFRQPRAFVFTSATLDPERFTERLGLGGGVSSLTFPSPFDFAGRSRLYIPRRMPLPNSPNFARALAEQMEALVRISRGRAFLLFTSFRNLEAVHKLLAPVLEYPVLKQGQAPKARLVEDFLEKEGAVLLATASFWQGVDIPGPNLSLVAIDKLPFAPPDDPLVAARIGRLRDLGQDPFREYQLPEAALSLRQGLGRLIRSQTDSGIMAVLDIRLAEKGYGKTILAQLPGSPLVRDLEELRGWAGRNL